MTTQQTTEPPAPPPDRWTLDGEGIVWELRAGDRLPHEDHIEMSGRQVSVIARFALDHRRNLRLDRRVFWPNLRGRADDVRGYLQRVFGEAFEPAILINGAEERAVKSRVRRIRFDGVLTIEHEPVRDLQLTRRLFPSVDQPALVEHWTLANVGRKPVRLSLGSLSWQQASSGVHGDYELQLEHPARRTLLKPGRVFSTALVFAAARRGRLPRLDADAALATRRERCRAFTRNLRLETPDPVLNGCFAFACLRACESLFDTKMGLVHSPGGASFYGGIWANDQIEYAAPLFPFIGRSDPIAASLNACRVFANAMKPGYRPIPSSFEVEGDVPWTHCGDRGDAAMYLYGCSRFLLALGDRRAADELWPALVWCAEYCRRKTNRHGVVESDTDELEGRFPAGKANLSTSAIACGGYRSAACVARELGKKPEAAELDARADALEQAIEKYFGATVEGFRTYRYFAGCKPLRAWSCLPLTIGIFRRVAGTVAALFSPRLWTADGVATQAGNGMFWDRGTVYALRGAFAAGETERALPLLAAFSRRRLLGDHVPYMVEEQIDQHQLAAESALYARVFTEGLFGITPTGFRSFTCRPRLPRRWKRMALRGLAAFGAAFDLSVRRGPRGTLRITVSRADGRRTNSTIGEGDALAVELT
jgi:hypothetical protein